MAKTVLFCSVLVTTVIGSNTVHFYSFWINKLLVYNLVILLSSSCTKIFEYNFVKEYCKLKSIIDKKHVIIKNVYFRQITSCCWSCIPRKPMCEISEIVGKYCWDTLLIRYRLNDEKCSTLFGWVHLNFYFLNWT